MAGATLTVKFSRRAIYSCAIAERHGRKQGGGVPVEVSLVLEDEVGANQEEMFAQHEIDRKLRTLPIAGIAVGASADVLSPKMSGTIGVAGVACCTGRSDASVEQETCTDVESRGWWRKR